MAFALGVCRSRADGSVAFALGVQSDHCIQYTESDLPVMSCPSRLLLQQLARLARMSVIALHRSPGEKLRCCRDKPATEPNLCYLAQRGGRPLTESGWRAVHDENELKMKSIFNNY